jgi:putative signal transducing protein
MVRARSVAPRPPATIADDEQDRLEAMRRLTQAPNLAIATLWADVLRGAGIDVTVQRAYASGIAGEIPPDQALPELWLADDAQWPAARQLLDELQHPRERRWACAGCGEVIEGPFDRCWACGRAAPEP